MILFFYGSNTYASHEEVERLVAAYIKKTGSDIGLERLDGEAVDAKTIAVTLQAAPFLVTSRLVVINNLGANKAASEQVLKLLDKVPSSTVLIFRETAVDQRTKWFKELVAGAKTVKFDPLTPVQLAAWIKREVARQGGEIDRPAASLLMAQTEGDQWRLRQEIGKLINYNAHITADTVKLLVLPTVEQSIFEFTDLVVAGQTAGALEAYRRLLTMEANEIYILSMIIWQLRNLLLAKTAGPMPSSKLAKEAKVSPFVAEKAQAKARRLSLEQLKIAFQLTVETDYQVKTGVAEPGVLVEKLIYQLSSEVLAGRG